MNLSIEQWHQRYMQQARWTHSIRNYLYQKCNIQHASNILDVGCGTGVLENEFTNHTVGHIFGLDIDQKTLQFAKYTARTASYIAGNCNSLPFPNALFDITLCHFLLLWIEDVQKAILEMIRVTKTGGFVMSLAEPDYGGRIDFPDVLSRIGVWQTHSLQGQGANPYIGRQLRSLYSKAGLVDIEVGVLGGQWGANLAADDFELEWQVLYSDLKNNHDFMSQADELKSLEQTSRVAHQRILFVPVFYAFGVVSR
jgi:ubiquinone/menaquinone biosynthesis C-methylase UbiE